MKIRYEIVSGDQIGEEIRAVFAAMLQKQGKVQGDLRHKANRCKLICIARVDEAAVGVGGIKPKTASDFSERKACVPHLSEQFEWELGYMFTAAECLGYHVGSTIANTLLESYGSGNLMASTELFANPPMVKILKRLGFQQIGTPWKSAIHENYLGLFLKWNREKHEAEKDVSVGRD